MILPVIFLNYEVCGNWIYFFHKANIEIKQSLFPWSLLMTEDSQNHDLYTGTNNSLTDSFDETSISKTELLTNTH